MDASRDAVTELTEQLVRRVRSALPSADPDSIREMACETAEHLVPMFQGLHRLCPGSKLDESSLQVIEAATSAAAEVIVTRLRSKRWWRR
jgi:hypothetical protein